MYCINSELFYVAPKPSLLATACCHDPEDVCVSACLLIHLHMISSSSSTSFRRSSFLSERFFSRKFGCWCDAINAW